MAPRRLLAIPFASLTALLTVAPPSGCASVDHVNAYREARAIYNDATADQNIRAGASLPDGGLGDRAGSWEPPSQDLSTGFADAEALGLHDRYTEAAILLRAINEDRTSRAALIDDRLYGSSATLQLLAEWKAAFYARLLGVRSPGGADPSGLPTEPPAMTELRARRDALVRELGGVEAAVFPRDQFYLAAMGPLLRYDNAFLAAVEWNQQRRFERDRDRADRLRDVRAVAEEMARAEAELARITDEGDFERHIVMASVAARQMMLRTGVAVALHADVDVEDGALWDFAAASSDHNLPTLSSRVMAFAEGAATPGDPVQEFLASLGVSPKPGEAKSDALELVGSLWAGSADP